MIHLESKRDGIKRGRGRKDHDGDLSEDGQIKNKKGKRVAEMIIKRLFFMINMLMCWSAIYCSFLQRTFPASVSLTKIEEAL